ncbi:hypothetical protein ACFQL0_13685 [Haloplanus litoreus]|uniref:hypothetical protein n=1 Tax=Haloplanus litoreus TaxID=767515 RepID=UPI003621A7B7
MTDAARSLDVYADLTLDVGDSTVTIRGYGDLIVVRTPSLAAARALSAAARALSAAGAPPSSVTCATRT